MKKLKFLIPQGKPNTIALQCEYLNMSGKMKPCTLDPRECVMGNKGLISSDGFSFTPIEQPSIENTLKNCPKLKLEKQYKCDSCGALMKRVFTRDDGLGYYECPSCGATMGEETEEWFKKQKEVELAQNYMDETDREQLNEPIEDK